MVKELPIEEWLTDAELRRRLNYSASTIKRLRQSGMPHVGAGRLRRYSWVEVRRWLTERV